MKYIKLLPIALIVSLVAVQQVSAQFSAININKLEVYGFARLGDESVKKAVATLYEDQENNGKWVQVQQMKSNINGEFGFKLDYNSKYVIEIAKANYISKRISFDTNVYGKTIHSLDFYFNVDFIPGVNTANSEIPVGNVFYHVQKNKFDYELNGEKAQAQ